MQARIRALVDHPALVLGLATFALHVYVNGSYGYFRDELYYIVCGRHPAFGYVDQPPLTPLIAWGSDAAFHSLRGLRLVPALACAATVALAAYAAGVLGGGLYARWLAGLAVLAGGVLQAFGVILITDTLQPLAWTTIGLCVIKAGQDDEPLWLIPTGVVTGVAFLAKYTVVFYLAAIGLGLVLTPQRRILACWQAWVAAVLAFLIASPNLVWQAANGWPFLMHGVELAEHRNIPLSPVAFILQEILTLGPASAPVWLAGLAAFAVWPRFAAQRWAAISFVALIATMIVAHGRPYYIAPAFPLMMAGGAVALEAWLPRLARSALAGLVVAAGALTAPFVMPLLPVETFIAYGRALGLTPSTGERHKLGALPQYYADMFGWPELAELVGKAYQALPPDEQQRAVFFGRNYGEAAAVDFFGAPWGLPRAISAHENYYLWGPQGHDGSVMFVLGGAREELLKRFRSVEPVGLLDNPLGMPYESGQTLWLCRDSLEPLPEAWPELRHFD